MSKCISREGEYSEHRHEGGEFVCNRCFAYDEEAAGVEIAKLRATQFVLAERERELLELKGPCSTCALHYAHSGPCDIR